MTQSDVMSRDCINSFEDLNCIMNEKNPDVKDDVMKIHKDLSHRRNIFSEISKEGIEISNNRVNEILKECPKCIRKDRKFQKSSEYCETLEPGEIVAIDIMMLDKNQKVILAIDYFSRFLFGEILKFKTKFKTIGFVKKLFEKFKFKKLLCDNGREFHNYELKKWCRDNNVILEFSIPHYHQSNGRIERANRTVREALKKETGSYTVRLSKVLKNYNDKLVHRAIGMPPREALLKENRSKVLSTIEKYKKEFKTSKLQNFDIEQSIIIRKEIK
ncbi:Gag-Pol polyprotein [Dictyocoela roeselum]|nr:Gag-Pol polyprotein [Dictyocoela roeselum]